MNAFLTVNEIFGITVQGEGPSAGMPCVFLRTSYCNLSCGFCDTPYTWNWKGTAFKHPDKYDREAETHKMSVPEVMDKLMELWSGSVNVRPALVISGGEPFMQQNRLAPLVRELCARKWWIEIETNGAILPKRPGLFDLVNQINCSPKLANSGDPEHLRIKPDVLEMLVADDKVNFKFVVGSYEDSREICDLVDKYKMRRVWIMPMGRTRDELAISTPIAKYVSGLNGWSFSPRMHIEMHGDKRGV